MKIRTTIPKSNKYYMVKSSGGYSGCIKGYPTIPTANVLCNCVGFANSRFNEIINDPNLKGIELPFKYQLVCNAENFIESAKKQGLKISKVPTVGGIMVWQKGRTLGGGDGAGHVAIVEEIYKDGSIYTSESGYGSRDWAFKNIRRNNSNGRWGQNSAYTFRGCIINPSIGGGEPVPTPKLVVDGSGGTATVMRMQEFFGTTQDGIISGQAKADDPYRKSLVAYKYGKGGSNCVKKMQTWLGISADGYWGKSTSKALQKKLGVEQDGYFGTNSMKAWQKYLNENDKPTTTPKPTTPATPNPITTPSASTTREDKICAWAKSIADGKQYKYKKWTSDKKTHECPICHKLTGKYKGWNCIGYAFASWKHGGGTPTKCSCGVVDNLDFEKMLKAKSDTAASKIAQADTGCKDVKAHRDKKGIPVSYLHKGDIIAYFDGNTYKHTLIYVGDGKVSDCSGSQTPNIKYGKKYDPKRCKVVLRYCGK